MFVLYDIKFISNVIARVVWVGVFETSREQQ